MLGIMYVKVSARDEPGIKRNKKSKRAPMINFFKSRKSSKHDTATNAAPTGKLFGHSLCAISAEDAIPKPILDMLQQLFSKGPFTSGIFRKSANQRCCRELRERLDNEEKVNFEDEIPIIVTAVTLKDFLRNMPDCLLLSDMYDTWIDLVDIRDDKQKADKVKKTLEQLPKPHVHLLRHVMCMLYHIDQHSDVNQMTSSNLAICISQSLLFPPISSSSTPSQTDTKKVSELIQFMIEHVVDIFGEDVISLFGEAPESKPRQDSSTDSDSMHSLLSLADNHGPRRDDSSLDSLDRDLYNSEIESSPRLLKSHLSNTNLSRDSGLTLSDTQLYNEEGSEMNEYPRVLASPNKQVFTRSVSQMDEQPQKMVSPEMLSRSYDGALESLGERNPPVPPPRKNKRRGAETPPNEQNIHAQIGGLHPALRGTASIGQMNTSHQGRLPKCDSLGSLDEYAESAESEEYVEIQRILHHQDQGMILRKSDSGAHLYMNEQLLHRNPGGGHSHGGRYPWVEMFDEDTPMQNLNTSYEGPSSGSLMASRVTDLSASYPAHTRPNEVVFTVTPPDSPDMPMYSKTYNHPPPPYNANRTMQVQSSQSTDGGYESSPTMPTRPSTLPIQRQSAHDTTDSSSCENSPALGGSGKVALRSPMDFQRDPTLLRKVQKGMTPTGSDIFPKHMRNMMRHSLQEEELKKVFVGRERTSLPAKQASAESFLRPEAQTDRRQIMIQMRQSRAVEKSASDSSVLDCFHSSQATTEPQTVLPPLVERRRPDKPPSYQEAIKRKSLIQNGTPVASPKEVIQQRANSDRARQLYEDSIRKYNEENEVVGEAIQEKPAISQPSPHKNRVNAGPVKAEVEEKVYETMAYVPEKSHEDLSVKSAETRQSHVSDEVQGNTVHISSSQTHDQSHEAPRVHKQSHDHERDGHMIKHQSHDQGPIDNRERHGSSSPYRSSSQCKQSESNVAQRHQPTPPSDHSKQGSRDSTPVRRNHSHERLARDNRNNQNERPKSRSKSREKRHGHRSSDTKLESSRSKEDKELRRSNLSRSKSDSQEHLNKIAKFKELKPLDSNIIERCKRAKMEDTPTSVDLASLDKPKRIQSVKHKDWHRELAEKYNQVFYQPNSVQQDSVPSYAYIKSTKQEANENERPKRRWTPPLHPSKDLILKSGEEGRSRRHTPPRTVVKSENDFRNGQQYENARKNAVAEKENRPAVSAHESSRKDLVQQTQKAPTRVTDSSSGEVEDFTMGDSNKISWSVARLRNLYDDKSGADPQGVVESSGPFYNPDKEGSRPPPPPYRHPPPINRSSNNSSQRRRPNEKTNPDAEESYV